MRQKMKRLMGILLSLVMLLGLMPGMSLTALAYDGNPYASLVGTTTSVTFNGKPWYIIADNSTAVDAGTVTLLAADTSFGLSAFSDSFSNDYSNSKVKASLDALITSDSFKDVADAIVTNMEAGGKLYLLSTSEADALSSAVLEMNFSSVNGNWWLRSPGIFDYDAAFVIGEDGIVMGDGIYVRQEYGVRPALKLNLSSVIFSSESNTFTLKPAGYSVTINPGSNMTKTADSGAASQTGLFDAMTPVVYTANDGYYFPTDYSVAAVNEISVTRNSFTQITVSGTPTAKTEITLMAPTAKSKETTPTATFTATGADTGTLSGVAAGMKYSLDGGTTWTDIAGSADINLTGLSAGTIQVVKKGNGTTTADSDPQSITVTKAETPNLTVTQPTAIGGKGTVATTTAHEYSSDNGSSWTACTANQEFAAGTYLIRVKASGTVLASGNQSVTITAYNPSKETTPSATFTATGADTGTLSGVADGMKYSLDNGTTWTDISGSADINLTGLSAGTIQVVKKGNGTTTADSDPQSITVTKAETPNLTVTQPTAIGGKGTVATTTAHEYSSDNGSNWTTCTANQEFDVGTYLIRVKASETVLASGNQSVTITAFNPSKETTPSATFTATGADTGTLSGVAAGMKYSLDNGTTWTDISGSADINLTGLSAGTIQVVKKGNGTTTSDSDPQSITVTKAETPNLTVTQPTAIGGKGTVATTTAHEYSSDNGSNWTACTANQEFDVGTYLIRVKASGTVLASGNQNVTISEAMGAYMIKSTQGTEHILGEDKDAVYIVTNSADDKRAFERFTGVSVDGKAVSEGNYTKASGSLVLTLKSAYLNTLSEGKHPMKISFSDGEVEISLTIKESTPTPTPKPIPKTGDQDHPGLWIVLMLIGIAGLTVLGTLKVSRKRK